MRSFNRIEIDNNETIIFSLWMISLFINFGNKVLTGIILSIVLYKIIFKKISVNELKKFFEDNKSILFSGIVFCISVLISTIFRSYTKEDIMVLNDFLKYFSFVIIPFFFIRKKSDINIISNVIVIFLIGFNLYLLYSYYFLNIARAIEYPNLYAWTLLATVPFLFLFYKYNYKIKSCKIVFAFTFAVTFIGLILTGSRACFLAFILTLMIILFLIRKYDYNKNVLRKIVMILMLIIIIFSPQIMKRTIDTINYNENYTVERFNIWHSTFNMINDNFVFGIGLNREQFKNLYDNHYMLDVANERHITHPHNVFLYWFVSTGVIGISGFLFFVYNQIKKFNYFFKESNDEIKLLAVSGMWFCFTFIISQMFDSLFYFVRMQKIYLVILGILIASIYILKESRDSGALPCR